MMQESENIIPLYERHAVAYDRLRGRSLFEKSWLDRFLALVPPGGAMLDMGCGMGEPIARYIIARGYALTGVDSSSSLIDLCKARYPAQTWCVADMRSLALGTRFDGILAWDSVFHLSPDDQRGMFRIFAAHAAPRTALMFTSGPSHGIAIGNFEGEPLYHASLDSDEYRTLLNDNGFAVLSHVADDAECGGHTVWLAQGR